MSRIVCSVAVVMVLACGPLEASISYGPYSGYWNIDTYAPLGQTFTAFSKSVSRISCWVAPWGNGSAADLGLRMTLYQGSGFGGTVLASRSASTPPPDPGGVLGTWGQGWADAWFSGVQLTPGAVYSIELTDGSSSTVSGDAGLWNVSNSIWGSVYPYGFSIRYGVVDYTWEDLSFRVLDPLVINGGFSSSFTSDWTASTTGTGSVVPVYEGGGDWAALLTAGSEVGISQAVNTLADPFYLFFDHSFQSPGVLDVLLGSVPVYHMEATQAGAYVTETVRVTEPSLLGAAGVELAFRFNGQTGAQLRLDNVYISGVPEPGTIALIAAGGAALLTRRRRRRR